MHKKGWIGLILLTYWVTRISCHGNMVKPHTWFDAKQWIKTDHGNKYDFIGMTPGMMCEASNRITKQEICPGPNIKDQSCQKSILKPGVSCMWYKNGTFVKKPTLFDPKLRTYPKISKNVQHILLTTPWRAPGSAPIDSPCGVAGGNLNGCKYGDCNHYQGGYANGPKAEEFKFKHRFSVTIWSRGSIVEVAWGILANHGGGYSYRLCKVPKEGVMGVTEECFQRTHLQFVGDRQWVQFGKDRRTRFGFKAVRTSCGTYPEGSQWTKVPIPACSEDDGGFLSKTAKCLNGTQFPPPREDLAGYGINSRLSFKPFQFSIIDKVLIPPDLRPGNYILSFRWDVEQTPQVWNSCASIYLC